MLWLQLIAGVLMFGAGVLLLTRAGTAMSKTSQPEHPQADTTSTRPSSSQGGELVDFRRWRADRRPRRRRARSFDKEFAKLTEQLRQND